MDSSLVLKFAFLLPFLTTWASADNHDPHRFEVEKEILKEMYMSSKFHMFIRPEKLINSTYDGPVDVYVSAYVLNLEVNTAKQEADIQMYFRQQWNDSRLSYQNRGKVKYLTSHDATGFWTPDLFFVSEKSGYFHTITRPNVFIRINPDGSVKYSQRVSLTITCEMNLYRYPFDRQTCSLPIESYGYDTRDIEIHWRTKTDDYTPLSGIAETKGFEISYTPRRSIVDVAAAKYSRLTLDVHIKRFIFDHVFHIFLPVGLLVVLSWLSFWISSENLAQRLTISLTSILCTLLQLYSNCHLFVYASYPTALDVWVAVSCLCVFGALLENIYVSVDRKKDADVSLDSKNLNGAGLKLNDAKKNESDSQATLLKLLLKKLSSRLHTSDIVARFFFPIFYIIFNAFYFGKLLIDSY